jgi:GNAT superfamily N-acetyltransferase
MTSDAIQLPDAPGIHGLMFRHFRAGDDFNHMATITRASAEVDDTERADTPDELASMYEHLTNSDPYTDMIFAEVDPGDGREPEVIGYSRGAWRVEGNGAGGASGERRYMFFGRLLPRWRRKGIGSAMLR